MNSTQLRIVFCGTADFAVPSLEALVHAGHQVACVVTQPDKPHGRGMQLSISPVKKAAEVLEIPIRQPRRVRSEKFIREISNIAPDLLVVAAFGQIIPQALLDIPRIAPINVHGSLLPKYRGAAPIQRAIMAGETITGVTTMWMDATLDTGDILLSAESQIEPTDNTGTVAPKLAALGADLLILTIDGLVSGTITRKPQDDSLATQSPMIIPDDCGIKWQETAQMCVNRIRGVSPRPGAYSFINGKRIKIWSAVVVAEMTEEEPGKVTGFSKSPAGLLVATGDGTQLLISEVQPESGKRMSADAWVRGTRIAAGMSFENT